MVEVFLVIGVYDWCIVGVDVDDMDVVYYCIGRYMCLGLFVVVWLEYVFVFSVVV